MISKVYILSILKIAVPCAVLFFVSFQVFEHLVFSIVEKRSENIETVCKSDFEDVSRGISDLKRLTVPISEKSFQILKEIETVKSMVGGQKKKTKLDSSEILFFCPPCSDTEKIELARQYRYYLQNPEINQ